MAAYYNEFDRKTAAWLRELIKAGLIADGEVDERSITDVQPADLTGFTQCHFFAGIGGWSYALRLACWPDDRAVWTGSCPCQPFSSAGKGAGAADSRDLWPAWFDLWKECRPVVGFGEQVASADGLGWLDRLYADLEAEGYAVAPIDYPAAGVGAFHIRQRLWFVADAKHTERRAVSVDRQDGRDGPNDGRTEAHGELGACGEVRYLADTERGAAERRRFDVDGAAGEPESAAPERQWLRDDARNGGITGDVALTERERSEDALHQRSHVSASAISWASSHARRTGMPRSVAVTDDGRCEGADLPVRQLRQAEAEVIERGAGFWSAADWIPCADGKWRPVEPGTFPLAHGLPARVGRLRGYGNAIVPQVAAEVIVAYMEITA